MKKFVMLLLVSLLILFTPMTAFAQSCWVRLSWTKYGNLNKESEVTLKRFVAGGNETVDLMLAEPVPDPGKYFQGWRDDATKTLLKDSVVTVTKVQYYTAIFDPTGYAITFDFQDGNLALSEMKSFGDEISQLDPTRVSLEFGGWYTDAQCTGERVSFPCTVTGDVTFYAKWTSAYDVRFFDENGAQIGDVQKVEHGKSATAPDDPAKEGHTFVGWNNGTDTLLSGAQIDGLAVTDTVDYSATFSANVYDVRFFDENGAQIGDAQKVEHGKSAIVPDNPKKEGHTFAGWSIGTDAPLSGEQMDGLAVTDTVDYSATFSANVYDVRFFDENGAQIGDAQKVEHGKSAIVPDNPKKEGHTFAGWSNGTGTPLSGEQMDDLAVTGSVDYMAEFSANVYDIRFLDEECVQIGDAQKVEHGKFAKAPDDPAKEGHTFAGWSNGTCIMKQTQIDNNKIIGAVNYTAVFEIDSYVVTFNANGVIETKSVEFSALVPESDEPTHEGHDFAGWLTDNGKRWCFETDKMPAWDITLNAHWNIRQYTVAFYKQDGVTPIGSPQTVDWDRSAAEETAPNVKDYAFDGWVLSGSDDTVTDSLTNVRENMKAIASYIRNDYKVTFVDEFGQVIGTSSVCASGSATAPNAPDKEGYTFIGWNTPLNNITDNISVTAQYEVNTYTVRFLDDNGGELGVQTVNWNTAATAPVLPERDGYTFSGWDTPFDKVTSDLTVRVQYRQNSPLDNNAGELEESNSAMTDTSEEPNEIPDESSLIKRAGNGELVMLESEAVPAANSKRDAQCPISLENRISLLHGHSEAFIIVLGFLVVLALGMSVWVVKVKKRR